MIIVKGFKNIKFGKIIYPEDGSLPYLIITVLSNPHKGEQEVGKLMWMAKGYWEIYSREETEEIVKEMDEEKQNEIREAAKIYQEM